MRSDVSAGSGSACEGIRVCKPGFSTEMEIKKPSDTELVLCLNSFASRFFGEIWSISENKRGDDVAFCPKGEWISRVKNKQGNNRWGEDEDSNLDHYRCCPLDYFALHDGDILCCPNGANRDDGDSNRDDPVWDKEDGWDLQWGSNLDGAEKCYNGGTLLQRNLDGVTRSGVGDIELLRVGGNDGALEWRDGASRYGYYGSITDDDYGEDAYQCTGECRTVAGNPVRPNQVDSLFDNAAQCGNCFNRGDYLDGNITNSEQPGCQQCLNGEFVSCNDYTELADVPFGCDMIPASDPEGRRQCARCLANNEKGVSGFIWTSFGCVDASKDGLITRIFQIGIGLIGGIMIIRFIQAALKMQTDNPEEIREAGEIITSAIIALIVLVGAIVIMSFLGINVLQIFPVGTFG